MIMKISIMLLLKHNLLAWFIGESIIHYGRVKKDFLWIYIHSKASIMFQKNKIVLRLR